MIHLQIIHVVQPGTTAGTTATYETTTDNYTTVTANSTTMWMDNYTTMSPSTEYPTTMPPIAILQYVINVIMDCNIDSDCLPLNPNEIYQCFSPGVCSCEEFGVDPAERICTPGE